LCGIIAAVLIVLVWSALTWVGLDVYYALLLWMCSIGLLASVPFVLAVRARRPQRMPWWLVAALAAALGWIASNVYAYLETKQIDARREELLREGALADFWQVADPSITLSWGWIVGLVYLVICLGPYWLFPANMNGRASRPFIGLLTVAVALAIFATFPPWTTVDLRVPFEFVVLYAAFLVCAGLSHQVLRIFRLNAAWHPFVVMFLVALLLRLAFRSWVLFEIERGAIPRPDLFLQIRESAEWAALFGGLFTAFWWIAIRTRQTHV
jgi:hypothetical protein